MKEPKKIYTWTRRIINANEPDNKFSIKAELINDELIPFEISGSLKFRDGNYNISIKRKSDGKFTWKINDQEGIASIFHEAYIIMPKLLNNPQKFQDDPAVELR